MTLDWIKASERLPEEDGPVILYLPAYHQKRPAIATLIKGDPNHDGEHYRRDKWLIHGGFVSTSQYVTGDQEWALIPTPASVTAWSTVRLPEPDDNLDSELEPSPPPTPPIPPAQPALFEAAP